jgi:hypothetical protein
MFGVAVELFTVVLLSWCAHHLLAVAAFLDTSMTTDEPIPYIAPPAQLVLPRCGEPAAAASVCQHLWHRDYPASLGIPVR